MRRLVAVMVASALVVSLAGCGGGGEEPAAEQGGEVAVQTQAPAAPPAPTGAAADAADTENTLSPGEEQVFEPFPVDDELTPDVVRQRLESGQPMLLFFYDGAQKATDDQQAAIDETLADYRGLIDLVSFDTARYVSTDDSGTISVKPGMEDDETAQQVARLLGAEALGVKFTPYIVFVNDRGYITYRIRGYVDSALIEREVLRATE